MRKSQQQQKEMDRFIQFQIVIKLKFIVKFIKWRNYVCLYDCHI